MSRLLLGFNNSSDTIATPLLPRSGLLCTDRHGYEMADSTAIQAERASERTNETQRLRDWHRRTERSSSVRVWLLRSPLTNAMHASGDSLLRWCGSREKCVSLTKLDQCEGERAYNDADRSQDCVVTKRPCEQVDILVALEMTPCESGCNLQETLPSGCTGGQRQRAYIGEPRVGTPVQLERDAVIALDGAKHPRGIERRRRGTKHRAHGERASSSVGGR